MYKTIKKEKTIQHSGNEIHQNQERSRMPTDNRIMGSYDSALGVIQMYKVPEDLVKHKNDLLFVRNRISEFNLNQPSSTVSRPVGVEKDSEDEIVGADYWAYDTRFAALRKYNEMRVVLKYKKKEDSKYQLGTNEKTESDVFLEDILGVKKTCIEVKTVSGLKSQIMDNVDGACSQLEERVPVGGIGIMEIYISEKTWEDVMKEDVMKEDVMKEDVKKEDVKKKDVKKDYILLLINNVCKKILGQPTYIVKMTTPEGNITININEVTVSSNFNDYKDEMNTNFEKEKVSRALFQSKRRETRSQKLKQ